MKQFKDLKSRLWDVSINVDAIKRVKATLDLDLLRVVEGKLIEDLTSDPMLLCNVVYVLCKEQADKQSITDEEFGRALGGDALDDAIQAVLEELVGFFPKARRQVLTKALGKFRTMESRAMELVMEKLDSKEFEQEMNQALQSATD